MAPGPASRRPGEVTCRAARRPRTVPGVDDLELRPFLPDQAELVSSWAPTEREVWTWVSRRTVPVPPDAIRGWAAEEGSLTYLVHEGDEPVAFGQIWLDDDEEDAELARLLVAPDHRGRGVGRRMVAAMTEVARQHKAHVAMRVAPGNESALRAYAAAGFERVDPATEKEWNEGQPVDFVWLRDRA